MRARVESPQSHDNLILYDISQIIDSLDNGFILCPPIFLSKVELEKEKRTNEQDCLKFVHIEQYVNLREKLIIHLTEI